MFKCLWHWGHDWGEWGRPHAGLIYHINHWTGRLLYKEPIHTQSRRCKRCKRYDTRRLRVEV